MGEQRPYKAKVGDSNSSRATTSIGPWCNGSTGLSESPSRGSSPRGPANDIARVAQLAEALDLGSSQCGFESLSGYQLLPVSSMARTPPRHGGDSGSNPLLATNAQNSVRKARYRIEFCTGVSGSTVDTITL